MTATVPWGFYGRRQELAQLRGILGRDRWFFVPKAPTNPLPSRVMSDVVIQVEHLGKYYRLGLIGGGTLRKDLGLVGQAPRPTRSPARDRRNRPRQPQGRPALGPARRQLLGPRGRDPRHHRPQRRRQEHPAQDPLPHHRPHRRTGQDQGPRRQPVGGRHRLPSRTHRAGEHLCRHFGASHQRYAASLSLGDL